MQKSLLNMTLLLSWLLLAAASSTSMSREEGTDYSYTDEEETRASKDGVLKGLIHINSSTLQVLPTLMERGITNEDMDYFHENEKRIRQNQSLTNGIKTSAASPTLADPTNAMVADPTQSSTMCANLATFYPSYRDVHGYMSVIICILGSIANVLNIIVLTRKDMNTSPINRILTGMAVADILLILEYIPYVTHHDLWIEGRRLEEQFSYAWSAYMWFHANFSVVIHNVSIWLTLTVAVWRFIMIRFHTLAPVYCTMSRCHLLILSAYIVPVFLSIPNYIAMDIVDVEVTVNRTNGKFASDGSPMYTSENVTKYVINFSDLAMANDKLLYRMNIALYSFILKLVPSIVLTVITGFLVHALYKAEERSARLKEGRRFSTPQTAVGGGGPIGRRISHLQQPSSQHMDPSGGGVQGAVHGTTTAAVQTTGSGNVRVIALNGSVGNVGRTVSKRAKPSSRRKSTDRTTRLLIVILVLFLLTEFPQGILGMLSTINYNFFYRCYSPLGDLMDDIALINSSINFIIYSFMSKQFRKTFLETFGLVEFCARVRCPSLSKAFAKLRRDRKSRKDSDELQCELVDIHVDGPQENEPILSQPTKQIQNGENHVDDEAVEIQRPLVNQENGCNVDTSKDTAV